MAKVGQRILDVRRHGLEIDAANDAVIGHFLEMLDQHLFADISHQPAELTGAFGPAGQVIEDQRLLLAPKDGQHRFEAALEIRPRHRDLPIHDTYQIVGTGVQVSSDLTGSDGDVDVQ